MVEGTANVGHHGRRYWM